MSRGPGVWQREVLRTTAGVHTATVRGIVLARLPEPTRPAYVAARAASKTLALAGKVTASYAFACARCGAVQDHPEPERCCGVVRAHLAVSRPGRSLAHPAPPPVGRVPEWVTLSPARLPLGQVATPTVEDVARLAIERLWQRLEADEVKVTVADAVALARAAHEQARDRAIVERDEAVAERDELQRQVVDMLWIVRRVVTREHGQEAWRALMGEVRKLRPEAS